MARDKLITIRIEGEKRKAFGELAKSQNTDTASLLYDFINQCLSGKIDIGIVTGKKQWIDKLDNQLDTNRLDKLETDTQEIDNRLDTIAKKLTDWVEAFDDRLTDSDQGLSDKMISLENRLNALASQLDSQQDRQQIDSIDTDSQEIDTGETHDIEPVVTVETVYNVEAVYDSVETDSIDEPGKGAIETAIKVKPRRGYSNSELSEKLNISKSTIEKWKARIQRGEKFEPKVYPNFFDHWLLDTDNLWYPEGRLLKKP